MARPVKGSWRERNGKVQFRVRGEEWTVGDRAAWPDVRIEAELDRIVSAIKAGVWTGPPANGHGPATASGQGPSFREAASDYLAWLETARKPRTYEEMVWRVEDHLLPYFGESLVKDIGLTQIEAYQAHKIREREYLAGLRDRRAAGAELAPHETQLLADRPNVRGISNSSINRTVEALGTLIERVQERHPGLILSNPARNRRLALPVKPPKRSWLDIDQVHDLFTAAQQLESEARVAYANLGRYEMIALLICSGLRRGELCDLRRRDLDLRASKLRVTDAKTPTGIREVHLGPFICSLMDGWLERSPFKAPADYLFPTSKGGRRDPNRLNDRIIGKAADRASVIAQDAGHSPLPEALRAHSLRRTYITLELIKGEDPGYVADQVGHIDTKLVMGIYRNRRLRRGLRHDPRLVELLGPVGGAQ